MAGAWAGDCFREEIIALEMSGLIAREAISYSDSFDREKGCLLSSYN